MATKKEIEAQSVLTERYEKREPLSLTTPRLPVTRKDYVDFVRPWAEDYDMTPEADQWGWCHGPLRILPPRAVFALEGDLELGKKIKQDMHTFAKWVASTFTFMKLWLIIFLCISATIANLSFSGEVFDDFNKPTLNNELWVVKTAGKGKFEIKGGKLSLLSPKVPDGVMLYWNDKIAENEFIAEAKADTSGIKDGGIVLGFIDEMLTPTVNTTINSHWLAHFVSRGVAGWYINDDDYSHEGDTKNKTGNETDAIWKIEIKNGKITFYVDNKKIVTTDKTKTGPRYLTMSPDTYTSHYSGDLVIDWIKLSSPAILSVHPADKLSVTWGFIKNR